MNIASCRPAWRPKLFRSVPAQFHAVLVWIAQIEGFAHAVVGGAIQGDVGCHQAAQGIGQGASRWVQDGKVIRLRSLRGLGVTRAC